MDKYKKIAQHYLYSICPSDYFNSLSPVCDKYLLFPEFREMIEEALIKYDEINVDNDCPYIYESFRSHKLQNIYYYRGASKIKGGNIMTSGMHHFGIAVDIINLIDKNGNKNKDKGESVDWSNINYKLLRTITRSMGINDLGSYEVCHFQMIPVIEQNNLRKAIREEIITFQENNGLVVDSIVGPKTIAKIKETL